MNNSRRKNFEGILIVATLGLAAVGCAFAAYQNLRPDPKPGLVTPVDVAVAPGKELIPASRLRAEGTLLAGPRMVDVGVSKLVEPGLMSVVFTRREVAQEFYDEATSNGESVCLSDLGPQSPEHKGQRFWLRSC